MRLKTSATTFLLFNRNRLLLSCLLFQFEPWISSCSFIRRLFTFSRFVNSIGKIFEHFIDICSTFSRYYIMRSIVLFSKSFSLFVTDYSEIFKIRFISSDCDDDLWRCVFLKLLDPFFYSLKWLSGNDLICNNGPNSIFVINRRNGIVLLLTSGILH